MNLSDLFVPPSGGSLEIGNSNWIKSPVCWGLCSPFGGIPRNWKHPPNLRLNHLTTPVPPSGGSLEIGNTLYRYSSGIWCSVPPSGGSLEIGNLVRNGEQVFSIGAVPPSGGSLEIGNYFSLIDGVVKPKEVFPLRGDP